MKINKVFWIYMGCIGLGLGTIGTVLPILPTVPFYLFAAFCFARSSKKIYEWFINSKLYKDNLEDYVQGNGMSKKVKMRIMCTLSLFMLIGFIIMAKKNIIFGCSILFLVWLFHMIYFIWGIKTKESSI